jgi:hypothetical protein
MAGKPLVSVFIDGLRADWVERMPFVRQFGAARRLQTEFGYSIACHASMYTGKSVQEHGYWFVWQRDPVNSAFPQWLERVPAALDNIPARLLARKALLRGVPGESFPRGFFRVPRLVNVPFRNWPNLWVSEPKFWDEDGYAATPTIFELARSQELRTEVVGLHRGDHLASVSQPLADAQLGADWFYLFFGEVDHAAHQTGGAGQHFDDVLRKVDKAIEGRCRQVEQARGGFDLLLWSDHGHAAVERHVDLFDRIDRGLLGQIPHFIDTNFARFWTKTTDQKRRLLAALQSVPEGWVLQEEELRKWECWFPDDRYGDVIFYLDAPAAFSRTGWGFSRTQQSVHGYIPTNDLMSATLVTTLDAAHVTKLRSIFDLHVDRLGLSDT